MKTFNSIEAFNAYFQNRKRGYGQISNIKYTEVGCPYQEAHGFFVARKWETALNYFKSGTNWAWVDQYPAEPGRPYENGAMKIEIEMFKEHLDDDEKKCPVWKVTARRELDELTGGEEEAEL